MRFLRYVFNQLISSKYLRNIVVLSGGVGSSQLITLILLPILTRFFSPSDFGVFALFMSIIQLFAISFTLRLEMAIILPSKNTDAVLLSFMSLLCLIIGSFLSVCIVFLLENFFKYSIIFGFDTQLFYLIPLGAFFLGLYNILYCWNNRLEKYSRMSVSQIAHSTISTPSSLLFYYLSFQSIGLVLGQILGRLLACFVLLNDLYMNLRLLKSKDMYNDCYRLWSKYKKFPLFELPQAILNFMSQKYVIAFFMLYFGSFAVGLFDLADKILGKPLSVISNSFKTVFYQRLTTAKNKRSIFLKSLVLMFLIGLCLTLPFYFIPDSFFVFILGHHWGDIGQYIQLICPLLFSRFVFTVISPSISYTLKNHLLLIWQIIYFVLLIILFWMFRDNSIEKVLFVYATFGALMYFLLGLISYLVLIKNIKH